MVALELVLDLGFFPMVFRLKKISFVNVRFFELLTKTETLDVVQMRHDVLPRWIDPLLFQIGNLGFHLQKKS